MINLTKRGCQVAEAKKPLIIQSACIFGNLEVKEALEVIETVEVIMADGVNEATEVVRFAQELEFNNLIARIIKFKLLSESDDLSGLISSISHDDLNSLDDFNSLFDLKITKNASTLQTEWFSWPQPPGQPLFVGLIIKDPIFL